RRWGTPLELEALRRNIALFSRNIDQGPFLSPIGRFLLRRFMKAHLHNRARTIAFYEGNRAFIESNGRYDAPLLVTGSLMIASSDDSTIAASRNRTSSLSLRSVMSRMALVRKRPWSVSIGLRLISTGNSVPSFRKPNSSNLAPIGRTRGSLKYFARWD